MDFEIKKKKNDRVKIIIIGILVGILIGIISFVLLNKNNKGEVNKKVVIEEDKKIVEEIKVDDFNEISVIGSRIEKSGDKASIYIKIKNNTNEIIDNSNLKLTIYDKDNNLLLTYNIENIKKLDIGDEVEFQVATDKDLSGANKYVVEKVE